MAELCSRIGDPQRAYRIIHVVGTNGKSSVTEIARRLLAQRGVRAGAYRSPHLQSWSERVRLPGGSEERRFAAAVGEVAAAAKEVVSERGADRTPTQFEVSSAAALLALARDQAEVAAIEAGLGGRLDATNICEAEVVALTTVALDHTQWLGETIEEIAAEKLAVLEPGATLVLGNVDPVVAELARSVVADAGGSLVEVFAKRPRPGAFPAENLEVASAAVDALLGADPGKAETGAGQSGGPTAATRGYEEATGLTARAELLDLDPPVLLDLAHNPAAAAALAGLPQLQGKVVVACVALLDDKDLAGFAAALGPALTELVATEVGELPGSARPGARSHPAGAIAGAFRAAGVEQARAVADPREAVEATLAAARERGGVALITGSHYLLRHSWIPGSDRS